MKTWKRKWTYWLEKLKKFQDEKENEENNEEINTEEEDGDGGGDGDNRGRGNESKDGAGIEHIERANLEENDKNEEQDQVQGEYMIL